MAGAKIGFGSGSTELTADADGNAKVNLPKTPSQAGYVQGAHLSPGASVAKLERISEDGAAYSGELRQQYLLHFNTPGATNWSGRIGTNATTMTRAVTNGFMRINNGANASTSTGISWYTNRVFNIFHGSEWMITFTMRHTNGNATNKQGEFGLGYYNFAAGQANQMNEFIGFRFKTDGTMAAVVATSSGGAPAEVETVLAGFPASDNVVREYRMLITDMSYEFWVDDVYQTRINRPNTMYSGLKGVSLPFIARLFNSGAASAAALFDIATVSVIKVGADDGVPLPFKQSLMGSNSYYFQSDLTSATTALHNSPASGTAPTAATGSNTASVLNNTGQVAGFFRMNGASIGATAHSIVWVSAFLNPVVPTAAGVAGNARNFLVTGITIAPTIVTTVLVGGGFSGIYFASIGSTAISSATTDADGTTAVAQKADRIVPLSRHIAYAAAAPVGTLETGQGDCTINFTTPLPVFPGEHLKIGLRTIWVNAAVTSGTIDGAIMVNGFWD